MQQILQPLQPLQLKSAIGMIDFAGISLTGAPQDAVNKRYYISVVDSIARILGTRKGSRVMRPDFGSDLYLLRDRNFGAAWRVWATRYIFEAIKNYELRVFFQAVNFNIDAITGAISFSITIAPRAL